MTHIDKVNCDKTDMILLGHISKGFVVRGWGALIV